MFIIVFLIKKNLNVVMIVDTKAPNYMFIYYEKYKYIRYCMTRVRACSPLGILLKGFMLYV